MNFYRPLVLNDHRNVYVWSDLHLGHNKEFILGPRLFTSVEEHDTTLLHRWCATVSHDSTIFILGDIMFGHNAEERLYRFLKTVPFKVLYLMPGNHAAGFKQLIERADENNTLFIDDKTVQFIPNYIEAYINKKFYVMSHYPILSANRQGKHDFGGMIHGHCHGNLNAPDLYKGKIMDVSVECCLFPQHFGTIEKYFALKNNLTYDHHENTSTKSDRDNQPNTSTR